MHLRLRRDGSQPQLSEESDIRPFYYVVFACVVAAVALAIAGHSGAAGFALMLGTGIEIIGAMVTGKQGNDTER